MSDDNPDQLAPVRTADIDAVRRVATPRLRAMIDFQLFNALSVSELCGLRRADVNTRADPWRYKTARGGPATLGYVSHAIVAMYLSNAPAGEPMFGPTAEEYRAAVAQACRVAKVTPFEPERLRVSKPLVQAIQKVTQTGAAAAARALGYAPDSKPPTVANLFKPSEN